MPKVTFDIEPATQGVKLTVIHDGFEPGSTIVQMVSVGWRQSAGLAGRLVEVP